MKVVLNLGETELFKSTRYLGMFIKPLLDALVSYNVLYIKTHHVPPLYRSGVRYLRENEMGIEGPEDFAGIPQILARGAGDCDDLSPWRVAELRCAGENAKIALRWRKWQVPGEPQPRRMYHVVVRRGSNAIDPRVRGMIEDPSKLLGMK